MAISPPPPSSPSTPTHTLLPVRRRIKKQIHSSVQHAWHVWAFSFYFGVYRIAAWQCCWQMVVYHILKGCHHHHRDPLQVRLCSSRSGRQPFSMVFSNSASTGLSSLVCLLLLLPLLLLLLLLLHPLYAKPVWICVNR